MLELLFEGLASLLRGIASPLSGIFTQQAADKTISLKKLFWLIFFLLFVVITSIEVSCVFNKNCIAFSWKMLALEFIACIGLSLFTVGLVQFSFWVKMKKKR